MVRNIFFDLDGTLSDCSQRLYNLFCKLEPNAKFSKDEYWKIRRTGIDRKGILSEYFNYTDEQVEDFAKKWGLGVEDEKEMLLDEPYEYSTKLLEKLCKNNKLYIVTARISKRLAEKQINRYGWDKFFCKILVTEQKIGKADLILANCKVGPEDIFVGDTGEDMIEAKKLKIKTIAITGGFFGEEELKKYEPDILVEGVEQIYKKDLL